MLTDDAVRVLLERIGAGYAMGWDEVVEYKKGISGDSLLQYDMLRLLAESQQALREIIAIHEADNMSFPDALDRIGEIASNAVKGGK